MEVGLTGQPSYRGGMTQVTVLLPPGPGTARIHAVELKTPAANQGQ